MHQRHAFVASCKRWSFTQLDYMRRPAPCQQQLQPLSAVTVLQQLMQHEPYLPCVHFLTIVVLDTGTPTRSAHFPLGAGVSELTPHLLVPPFQNPQCPGQQHVSCAHESFPRLQSSQFELEQTDSNLVFGFANSPPPDPLLGSAGQHATRMPHQDVHVSEGWQGCA